MELLEQLVSGFGGGEWHQGVDGNLQSLSWTRWVQIDPADRQRKGQEIGMSFESLGRCRARQCIVHKTKQKWHCGHEK